MKELIAKIRNGDPLSDGELKVAIDWYTAARNMLEPFGELYKLVWKDINQELIRLEGYQILRKSK